MIETGVVYFMLSAGYRAWATNPLVGYNLYAPLPLELNYRRPDRVVWIWRAMLAEDIPEVLRAQKLGSILDHDFGGVPREPKLDECTPIELVKGFVDIIRPHGMGYQEHTLDRELEAASFMPATLDAPCERLLFAA